MIDYEIKGKTPFNDYSYAKLIIATNSLPTTQDSSDGFYRRWVIIRFPNEFTEGSDVVESIPDYEFSNLALRCCGTLKYLLDSKMFDKQGDIEERKKKYIMASNPLCLFLTDNCKDNIKGWVRYNDLYLLYLNYLKINKYRRISRKEFKQHLEDEGHVIERQDKKINGEFVKDFYINGIEFSTLSTLSTRFPYSVKTPYVSEWESSVESVESVEKPEEIIFLSCSVCGNEQSDSYDKMGRPVCRDCKTAIEIQKS